jgi:UDP-2-acetamido-3-amino-2,3-dideoxy-glucuronate N-acetyltransferase
LCTLSVSAEGDGNMSEEFLNVAVVGAGYWGKNLVRNFATTKRCNLKYVCDLDEELLAVEKKKFPFIKTSTKLEEVLGSMTDEMKDYVADTILAFLE